MATDTRGQTRVSFHGKAGLFFPEQKATILREELWA
jgi:hypothetical protein